MTLEDSLKIRIGDYLYDKVMPVWKTGIVCEIKPETILDPSTKKYYPLIRVFYPEAGIYIVNENKTATYQTESAIDDLKFILNMPYITAIKDFLISINYES